MRRVLAWTCSGVVLALFVAATSWNDPAFADPESDCASLPDNVNGVHWNGAPNPKSTTSSGTAFSYNHAIIWCYGGGPPSFGSFAFLDTASTNVTSASYSPLYFYPSTHYGVLNVGITGTLTTENDGILISRVNVVYPWTYHDGTLNIDYAAP